MTIESIRADHAATQIKTVPGETIAWGAPVAIKNVAGVATAFKADADGAATLPDALGLASSDATVSSPELYVRRAGPQFVPDAIWDAVPAVTDAGKPVYLSTTAGQLTITRPALESVREIGDVAVGGAGLVIVNVAPKWSYNALYAPALAATAVPWGVYGDGSDGAHVVAGAEVLTAAAYYTDLTVPAGQSLDTANFPVFCSGTLTVAATGVLSCDGAAAALGVAGAGSVAGQLAGGKAGGAGGTAGGVGAVGTAATTALGGAGGAGGAAEGPVAGGIAGAVTAPVAALGRMEGLPQMLTGALIAPAGVISAFGGAGGGGGGSKTAGSVGGGGGGGGGVLLVAAKTIVNAGTMRANGGAGAAASSTAGGGGGGGGGGGAVLRTYHSLTETGTCVAAGGALGAATGTGVAGAAGAAGVVKSLVN